ncbi:MAG: family 10 glycosylhydrolase [Fimbriimonadaceae bacterium]
MSVLTALLTIGMAGQPAVPAAPREARGVWIATVDNIDWPSNRNLSTAQARAELVRIFDEAKRLRLNLVVFQVRPMADSLYESQLEPWSEFLTGQMGRAPAGGWDPLKEAIELAHARGMELHAWFNPYRAGHPGARGPASSDHISKTNPELVRTYGRFLWMDPSEPKVQQRSLDVMLDVVRRYNVDGIHIDDYFYPYPITENGQRVPFPDEANYRRYRDGGGTLSIGDWRRKQVDDFVQRLHNSIKREKPWVKFGISPFGIYRPGIPEGIRAGVDQFDELYADALKWLQRGWCDYFTPQLYWPINQAPQSYRTLIEWWSTQNTRGIHLWPGNFTSRLWENAQGWSAQEVIDQIELTRRTRGATGNIHFSMRAFLQNSQGIADRLAAGPYARPALIPASPWIDRTPPSAPRLERTGGGVSVAARDDDVHWIAVYRRGGSARPWELAEVLPAARPTIGASLLRGPGQFGVTLIDRAGNESRIEVVPSR